MTPVVATQMPLLPAVRGKKEKRHPHPNCECLPLRLVYQNVAAISRVAMFRYRFADTDTHIGATLL